MWWHKKEKKKEYSSLLRKFDYPYKGYIISICVNEYDSLINQELRFRNNIDYYLNITCSITGTSYGRYDKISDIEKVPEIIKSFHENAKIYLDCLVDIPNKRNKAIEILNKI